MSVLEIQKIRHSRTFMVLLGAGIAAASVAVLVSWGEKGLLAFAGLVGALLLTLDPLPRLFLLVALLPFAHLGLGAGLGGFGVYDVYNLLFLLLFGARLILVDFLHWPKIPVMGWAWVMVAAFLPSLVNAPMLSLSLKAIVQFLVSAVTTAAVCYYLSSEGQIEWAVPLLKLFVLEAAAVAAVGVYQSRGESLLGLVTGRAYFGAFGDVNCYATYLVVALAAGLGIFVVDRRWHQRLLYGGAAVVTSVAIISTVSRSALAALALVALTFAAYVALRQRGRHRLTAVVIVGAFAAIIGVLLFTSVGSKVVDLFALSQRLETVVSGRDASLGQREKILTVGSRAFEANPVIGVGFGNFEQSFNAYRQGLLSTGSARSAHNTAMRLLVETGVIGFLSGLLFLGSLAVFLWKGLRAARHREDYDFLFGLVAALGVFLLMSFTLDELYEPEFWIVAGIALAVASYYRRGGALFREQRESLVRL